MEAGYHSLPSIKDLMPSTRLSRFPPHHGMPAQSTFDSLGPPLAGPHPIMVSSLSKPNTELNSRRPLSGGHAEQSRIMYHTAVAGKLEGRAQSSVQYNHSPISSDYPPAAHPNSVQPRQEPPSQMPPQNGLFPPGSEFFNAPWPQTHAELSTVADTQNEATLEVRFISTSSYLPVLLKTLL